MAKSKSFSSVASSVWNELPGHLSSISTLPAFRKRLKHHLFLSAFPSNPSQRVHNWLLNNGLYLNPSKSEAIAFYNPKSKPLDALTESIVTVSVAGSPIRLQSSIKNLGVYLDSTMSFDKQVSETCKACYFHIRVLRHIRASLTTEACKTIAAAIAGSRLDFCNSLLAGTSVSNLARLQHVQNPLARVVAQKTSVLPHHTCSL